MLFLLTVAFALYALGVTCRLVLAIWEWWQR